MSFAAEKLQRTLSLNRHKNTFYYCPPNINSIVPTGKHDAEMLSSIKTGRE